MLRRQLYQFPLSHYCEKVRWALEYKGLEYDVVNLVPGFHRLTTKKMSKKGSVPILQDGETFLTDSKDILDYLDKEYPDHSLSDFNDDDKILSEQIETYVDEKIAVNIRRIFYYWMFSNDRDEDVKNLFLNQAQNDKHKKWFKRLWFIIKPLMIRALKLNAEAVEKSEKELVRALDQMSIFLTGKDYCIGGKFSRTDITVASYLAPLCLPAEHPFKTFGTFKWPDEILYIRDRHFRDRVVQWTLQIYKKHRICVQPSNQV